MAERRQGTKRPGEFVRDMPEGESAGPGAPETVEPTTGRPGAGGHGPQGPGGPAMAGIGEGGAGRTADADARPDAKGAAGFLTYVTQLGAGAMVRLRGSRRGGGPRS
jgi:hypothetical protein